MPIAALVAIGLSRVAGRMRVTAAWQVRGTAFAAFCIAALALVLGFRIFYTVPGRSFGEGLDRFLLWVPWSPPVLLAMAGAYAVAGVVLAAVLARRPSPTDVTGTGAPGGPDTVGDPVGGPSVPPDRRDDAFQVTQTPGHT